MSKTILQVIPNLDTGGAERTAVDIAAALSARGDIALVASEGGRMEAELKAAGGELCELPLASKNPLVMVANAGRLAALVRARSVDIVHARSRAPAWSALLACRMTGVPFVTTYHGIYGQKSALKGFYNSVMARGDAVIANSGYTADLIAARHGTPKGRITTIYRGTDLSRFDPGAIGPERTGQLRAQWGIAEGTPIILNVARLTSWKGQEVLIEAAARIAQKADFALVLAGDAQGRESYRARLLAQTEGLGLSGRVFLPGHTDDVPAALALASLAVVASTEPEAFGRFAVEAQAMGVPTIVSDLGPARETVLAPPEADDEERSGWRVSAGDSAGLARALETALALPHVEREAVARRARAHAATFSLAAMTAATLKLYDEIPSGARKR
ncbi:glycosyltransferase family 4 protein [Afifella sp. IM 167]|uniref:glycosyltransferase family 4 protein n=1 Tax=Afifella sp. IM 167 TaxID=2033586 RepID=UPI001CCFF26E|nr:glycosyltransferase family 4 protein [Afifella sp. IM 167]MBZ8133601.1 glycosyl transferase [Afifella sp. IM 167]